MTLHLISDRDNCVDLRVELLKKTPSEGIRGALTVRLIFSYSLKSMAPEDIVVCNER